MARGQKPNGKGINWDRVAPDNYEALAALAVEASRKCDGKSSPIQDDWGVYRQVDHTRTHHYTARDGSERCAYRSFLALEGEYNYGTLLKGAVSGDAKKVFSVQVRQAVAA